VPTTYQLLLIDAPDNTASFRVETESLPSHWKSNLEARQKLGERLLNAREHLIVFVPSVLVPHAWNALLNPRHADARRCAIIDVVEAPSDARLIR
jgi:RES domain-containing protein